MMRRLATLMVTFGVLLSAPGLSMAADYCISLSGGSLVVRGFTVPPRGQCRNGAGFVGGSLTPNIPITYVGCTSSDRSQLNFTLTGSNPGNGGNIFFGSVTLSLPAQTGTYNEQDLFDGSTNANGGNPYSVTGGACRGGLIGPAASSSPSGEQAHGVAGLP